MRATAEYMCYGEAILTLVVTAIGGAFLGAVLMAVIQWLREE